MVNSRSRQLDEVFFALSDPTRRAIVARLSDGDTSVAELSEPFQISGPAISKHLRVLERAGLLTQRRQGRGRQCTLLPDTLREAADWVHRYRRFWDNQLDLLAEYMDKRSEDDVDG